MRGRGSRSRISAWDSFGAGRFNVLRKAQLDRQRRHPAGGYAYVRGGGKHFQQDVSWWSQRRDVIAATDSGLLGKAQVAVETACLPGVEVR